MYKVRDKYKNLQKIVRPFGNRRVNLFGVDVDEIIPATKAHPAITITVRGATQEELKQIFEEEQNGGTKILEYIPDPEPMDPKPLKSSRKKK